MVSFQLSCLTSSCIHCGQCWLGPWFVLSLLFLFVLRPATFGGLNYHWECRSFHLNRRSCLRRSAWFGIYLVYWRFLADCSPSYSILGSLCPCYPWAPRCCLVWGCDASTSLTIKHGFVSTSMRTYMSFCLPSIMSTSVNTKISVTNIL